MKNIAIFIFSIYAWSISLIIAIISIIFMVLFYRFFKKPDEFIHNVCAFSSRLVLKVCFVRVKTIFEEDPKKINQPFIILSNHQSMLDILIITGYLPIQFKWFSKASVFDYPIFGKLLKIANYIPVDRHSKESSKKALLMARELIKKGYPVVIFPEGTRSQQRTLLPFKKGAFLIIKRENFPILPIAVDNSYKVVPSKNKKFIPIIPKKVYLIVGKLIKKDEIINKNIDEIINITQNKIKSLLEQYGSNNKKNKT